MRKNIRLRNSEVSSERILVCNNTEIWRSMAYMYATLLIHGCQRHVTNATTTSYLCQSDVIQMSFGLGSKQNIGNSRVDMVTDL